MIVLRIAIHGLHREFQRSNFSLENAEREGRFRTSITVENITALRKMLDGCRRITYQQIEDISGPIHSILYGYLHMKKICCLSELHKLIEEQKTQILT